MPHWALAQDSVQVHLPASKYLRALTVYLLTLYLGQVLRGVNVLILLELLRAL